MSLLVDLLWRDLQALYTESKLAETDINKADSEHPEYDPRYKFVRDIIRINRQVMRNRWALTTP